MNMRLVRKILVDLGYEMLEAINGVDGLSLALQEMPDVILVDINLPDIDGVEVTRQLKANPQTCHIPIIALTANSMYGDRERFLESGCDGYIAKPIARLELRNVLHHFLSNSHLAALAS